MSVVYSVLQNNTIRRIRFLLSNKFAFIIRLKQINVLFKSHSTKQNLISIKHIYQLIKL